MRKKLSVLLVLILCISLVPVFENTSYAAGAFAKTIKITAKGYGAKKGKDCTAAIQKALDAATKAGTAKKQAKVVIPKGTYYISNELVIGSNTYLELADGAVIKKNPETKNTTFYMLHTKTGKKGKYADNTNITIVGGVWDGEFKNHTGISGGSLFVFAHGRNITVRNTTLKNNFGTHLIELDGVKNCVISDCDLYGFKAANKDTEKEAIQLDVCHDDVIAPGAAPYDDTPCTEIIITKNDIHDYPRAFGSHTMIEGIYHSNITVSDNKIHNISGAAIYGYNYIDIRIIGNIFSDVGCGIQLKSYSEKVKNTVLPRLARVKAMKLEDNAFNIQIKSNQILTSMKPADEVGADGGSLGIFIYGTYDYPMNNVEIEKNMLVTDSSGVYFRYVNNATIKKNTVDRHDDGYDVEKTVFAEDAIKLASVSNAEIFENDISTISSSSYENGIAMRDVCKNVTSYQNTIFKTTKSGIAAYGDCQYIGRNEMISTVGKHGVTLDGAKADIYNLEISGCGENGITLKNNASVVMYDSLIRGNVGKGICVMSGSNAVLNGVVVENNDDTGIYSNESTMEVYDCKVTDNMGKGINVVNESSLILENTQVINSGSNGLKADSCLVEAEHNTFLNNCQQEADGKAVFMMMGTSGKFANNVIYNPNTKYEIYLAIGIKFKPDLASQKTETIRGKKDVSGNVFEVE